MVSKKSAFTEARDQEINVPKDDKKHCSSGGKRMRHDLANVRARMGTGLQDYGVGGSPEDRYDSIYFDIW